MILLTLHFSGQNDLQRHPSVHIFQLFYLIWLHFICIAAKDDGDKKAGKLIKMLKDPVYLKFVDQVFNSLSSSLLSPWPLLQSSPLLVLEICSALSIDFSYVPSYLSATIISSEMKQKFLLSCQA